MTSQLWDGSTWANLAQDVYEYDITTSVGDGGLSMLPNGTGLSQNYPNPFNPSTLIGFTLPSRSDVTVEVFDLLGRSVVELFSGQLGVGDHTLEWNGRNQAGSPVASGVYFYRLTTDAGSLSRKMLLVK